ncbi:MAG: hypothetical protein ABI845_03875 [Polaromonas sp.]
MDGCGVPGDVPDESVAQMGADQGFVQSLWQAHPRKLAKGAAERRLAGHLVAALKAQQRAQVGIGHKPLAQLFGLPEPEHGLDHERLRKRQAAALGRAGPLARVAQQTRQIKPVQGVDDALVLWRQAQLALMSPLPQFELQQFVVLAITSPCRTVHG